MVNSTDLPDAPESKPGTADVEEKQQGEKLQGEKLQKVLADAGYGSRREIERQIERGVIKVNGKTASLGLRVFADDAIVYMGKRYTVPAAVNKSIRMIIYNKPEGEICSNSDPEGRRTVFDKMPSLREGRWISVGRLDFNTSGLLLFTDSGELANKLMHPSSEIDREYLVRLQGEVTEDVISLLKQGVMLEDGIAKFTDIVDRGGHGTNKWYYCALMEGRKREVRRLWESQGLRVSRLKRVRFGPMFLPSILKAGQWLELDQKEVASLCKHVGMSVPKFSRFTPKMKEQRERHIKKLRSSNKKRSGSSSGNKRTTR